MAEARAFLNRAGWGGAARTALAGDASSRRYERLCLGEACAVLMDAGDGDLGPFLRVGAHLARWGVSVPRVIAGPDEGFLLLEDLGEGVFARLAAQDSAAETTLAAAATDLLLDIQRHPAPADLALLDPATLGDMTRLAFEWYAPEGRARADAVAGAIADLAARAAPARPVLVHRDYHGENLLWLPERDGVACVGVIDFQDAVAGHPAYDLVSLLRDARRDVAPRVREAMIARHVAGSGADDGAFRAAAALLGVQRNLRILGVFARLARRDGKVGYLALMGRVWDHLRADLAHPALARLRALLDDLPAPTPARIRAFRDGSP